MSANPELQMILDKIETMESNIEKQFKSQEKYLNMRLDYAETSVTKAHTRLDDHKKSITEICEWKHQMKSPDDIDELFTWRNKVAGAMWVIPFILTPLTVLFTTWLLTLFGA